MHTNIRWKSLWLFQMWLLMHQISSFDVEHFKYDKVLDQYTCPANETLETNGHWYNKKNGKTLNRIKQYKTKACKSCVFFTKCTRNKAGRLLERTEHADLIEENKRRISENLDLYRRRQAIVEHPFGVIKRQWDFYYIMTKKSMKHASADVGLIFTSYNLRRILNLVNKNELRKYIRSFQVKNLSFNRPFSSRLRCFFYSKGENKIEISLHWVPLRA